MRAKIICNYCGRLRAESPIFSGLCDACAKKLQLGIITTDQIDARKELIRRPTTPEPIPTQPEPIPTQPEPIPTQPDPIPTQPEPIPTTPEHIPRTTNYKPADPLSADMAGEYGLEAPIEKKTTTEPAETEAASAPVRYFCDVCGAELRRGEYECPKCHVVNDWRHTDVETDPDIVICDRCGAITDGRECRRCGGA